MLLKKSGLGKDSFDALVANEARISYSQLGEDVILAHHMRHERGFYVDVGCHDPFRFSNTALFHTLRGWRGINIDADPHAIARFNKARPDDINVHSGVGSEPGSLEFVMFPDPARSSFHPDMIRKASRRQKEAERITVPVRPLRDILAEHLPAGTAIDYMNIDCEGFDDKVVEGNDWERFAPRFVSIEIHGLDLARAGENGIVRHLARYGYRLTSQCLVTSIFERAVTA